MAYLSRTLEKVIKLNSSPIKLSWWAASYLTRWINGACYWHFYYCHFFYFSVKNELFQAVSFVFLSFFVCAYVLPWSFVSSIQAPSLRGLRLNPRRTVKLVTQALTALHGLRLLPTSSVPLGGSVQQDQRLDISQVEYTSLRVNSGLTVVFALSCSMWSHTV